MRAKAHVPKSQKSAPAVHPELGESCHPSLSWTRQNPVTKVYPELD